MRQLILRLTHPAARAMFCSLVVLLFPTLAAASFDARAGVPQTVVITQPAATNGGRFMDAKELSLRAKSGRALPSQPKSLDKPFHFEPYLGYWLPRSTVNTVVVGDVTGDGRADVVMGSIAQPPSPGIADPAAIYIFIQQASGQLADPVSLPYDAQSLALGDFNGDGVKDIVVGQQGKLTILTRSGGNFVAHDQAVPFESSNLAVLDIDQDGKLDVLVRSTWQGATLVFGDGSGGVRITTPFPGFWPHGPSVDLAVGDVTGDGVPDLVGVAQHKSVDFMGANEFWVYPVLPGGGFAEPHAYAKPVEEFYFLTGVAIGDFNHDGRKDVALSAGRNSLTDVFVMYQGSDGTLGKAEALPSYDIPENLIGTDADGDGLDDLLVVHSGWDAVGRYMQQTDGKGLATEWLTTVAGSDQYTPNGIAVGDVDGDGCGDFAITSSNYGLLLYRGVSCVPSGANTPPSAPIDVSAVPGNAQAVVTFTASDFPGSSAITGYTVTSSPVGGTDTQAGTNALSHLVTGLSNGTAYTFSVRAKNAAATGVSSKSSAAVTPQAITISIDDNQAIETNYPQNQFMAFNVHLSQPSSAPVTFELEYRDEFASNPADYVSYYATGTIPAGATSTQVQVSVTGDNVAEPTESFFVTLKNVSGAVVVHGTARGTILDNDGVLAEPGYHFVNGTRQSLTVGGADSVAIGDVTGDGLDDVVFVSVYGTGGADNGAWIHIRAQAPDGSLKPEVRFPYLMQGGTASFTGLVLTDLNRDGVNDIVVGHRIGLTILLSDGHGSFKSSHETTYRSGEMLAALDVDLDGNMDIADGGYIYYGDGTGQLSRTEATFFPPDSYNDFKVGDVTGDGLPDLVFLSDRRFWVVPMKPGGGFAPNRSYPIVDRYVTVGIGDFDNDGRNDLVFAQAGADEDGLIVYHQDEQGELRPPTRVSAIRLPGAVVTGDLNNDGLLDVLVLHSGLVMGRFVQGDGTGLTTEQPTATSVYDGIFRQSLAIGDVNGDGCPDVAVVGRFNGIGLATYLGQGCVTTPSMPMAVTAVAGDSSATIRFLPPARSPGSPVDGYTVLSVPSSGTDLDAGSEATTHRMVGLVNGVSYTFAVRASNRNGTSPASVPSNKVVPSDTITLTVDDASVVEGAAGLSDLPFRVLLSRGAPTDVSFDVDTSDRTALGASDYIPVHRTHVVIPAGKTELVVAVPVRNDTMPESDETLVLNVTQVIGATVTDGQAIGTIVSDDAPSPLITTIAGNRVQGFSGDGGPALSASIGYASSIAVDPSGNVYFTDQTNERVRRIDKATGIITTAAGNGVPGFSGDGGYGSQASLSQPRGIAFDALGNLYIADALNDRVRKVNAADGKISTVAGNGVRGFSGDGGLATAASFSVVSDVAFDAAGNLYIADAANYRVRKVTPQGIVSTVARSLQGDSYPYGFWGCPEGDAMDTPFHSMVDIEIDPQGRLLVADDGNQCISRLDTDGKFRTFVGLSDRGLTRGWFSGDGGQAKYASIYGPSGMAFDARGNFYFADLNNRRVRRVDRDGVIQTVVGGASTIYGAGPSQDGIPATSTDAGGVQGVAVDGEGNLLVTSGNTFRIRKVVALIEVPELSIANASTLEGDVGSSALIFQVTLSAPATRGGVTFLATTSVPNNLGDGAAPNDDFWPLAAAQGRIEEGLTNGRVVVKVRGDTVVEPDERLDVVLTSVSGARPIRASATGVIVNDDSKAPTHSSPSLASMVTPAAVGPVPADASATLVAQAQKKPLPAKAVVITPIAAVQGRGLVSPMRGRNVAVRGVVTAIRRDGVFLQTIDVERDADPATSDAIFVQGRGDASVGDFAEVAGRVVEWVSARNPDAASQTRVVASRWTMLDKGRSLPVQVALVAADLSPRTPWSRLARYESMRVVVPTLTVVAPSERSESQARVDGEVGIFHGVLAGVSRPFRESGVSPGKAAFALAANRPPLADGNPERLRVDSLSLWGARAIAVDVGDRISGLAGVISDGDGAFSLLVDASTSATVATGSAPSAVSSVKAGEISLGFINLARRDVGSFPSTPTQRGEAGVLRLAKIANAICGYARNPDLMVVDELADTQMLGELADATTARAGDVLYPRSCPRAMSYRAVTIPDDAHTGVDLGLLVGSGEVRTGIPRLQVLSARRLAATAQFVNRDGSVEPLNERPPIIAQLRVNRADGSFESMTAVAVHWHSLAADVLAPGRHGWVSIAAYDRAKRKAQAMALAQFVQAWQLTHPAEGLVVLGGFEASEVGDGEDDLLALAFGNETQTISSVYKGGAVNPSLRNLTLQRPEAQRYTAVRNGDAQALDHILVNRVLSGSGYTLRTETARVNADFAEDNSDDVSVPLRYSDSDPVILYIGKVAPR